MRKSFLTRQDVKCERRAEASDSSAVSPVLFCGLAGFSDFFKPDWLQWIVQRQDRDLGCFGRDGECDNTRHIQKPSGDAAHTRPTFLRERHVPDGRGEAAGAAACSSQQSEEEGESTSRSAFTYSKLKQMCPQTEADLIRLWTPFRRLLQPHHISRRWHSGGILGLLPDRTGHNEEAALLNAKHDPCGTLGGRVETVQDCTKHQDLV